MFLEAIMAFDDYNSNDPNREDFNGAPVPKELLYAQRMTAKLSQIRPNAGEALRLAARSQHIGRWEIPRSTYPMDRNGYLKWRSQLKIHHTKIAEGILRQCGYNDQLIEEVKFLLMKKRGDDSQLLEDVICLVFIEFYLADFASKQEEEKVVDIVMKTMKKMSKEGIELAGQLPIDHNLTSLLEKAVAKLGQA